MIDLKNEVVNAVQGLENEALLQEILELILRGNFQEGYVLSQEQNSRIEAACENYKHGQIKSHREAMEETRRWLLNAK